MVKYDHFQYDLRRIFHWWNRFLSGRFRLVKLMINLYQLVVLIATNTKIKLSFAYWIIFDIWYSMTSLLTNTVAHSTRHSFRPKANNHSIKNSISLEFTWAKVFLVIKRQLPLKSQIKLQVDLWLSLKAQLMTLL